MSSIDIFSNLNVSPKEAFKYLTNSHIIQRCSSPFFKLENFHCKNSKIDIDTYFLQKSVLSELFQLFFKVKEIVPENKIVFEFDGLIQGTQTIYVLDDPNIKDNCLIREKIEFHFFNQFSFPLISLALILFFYFDTFVKHIRLKSIIKKETGLRYTDSLDKYLAIKSYIVIDANLQWINSLFEDLTKFSLWLLPFLKIESQSKLIPFNEGQEFLLGFIVPFFPKLSCRIVKKSSNQITVSFENSLFKGKNIWSFIPCEHEFVIENTIEIENIIPYLSLVWFFLSNTVLKQELNDWNRRLKDIVEKTNLSQHLEYAHGV